MSRENPRQYKFYPTPGHILFSATSGNVTVKRVVRLALSADECEREQRDVQRRAEQLNVGQ